MKKSKRLISALAIVLLLGMVVFVSRSGTKPFQGLKPSEIASATVRLSPPGTTIQIMELKQLTDYLNDVVIYAEDNSYTEYCGQGVAFTLMMADGTQTEVMAYNPFFVIDGVGYKTEYQPCEALNSYANRLLNEGDPMVILEEPPQLAVVSGGTSIGALRGTYSWQRKNNDGTFTSVEADSAHPLDCKDLLPVFETTEATAALRFTEKPDAILNACCWGEEHWADPAASSESVFADKDEIELKPGGYIYEITAQWNTEKSGYGGIARYAFYVVQGR